MRALHLSQVRRARKRTHLARQAAWTAQGYRFEAESQKKRKQALKAHELWSESQRKQAKRHKVEGPRMPYTVCESAGY